MRSTGATLLVAGALGFATYYYGSTQERNETASHLAKVTHILTRPAPDESERPRVFSPQRPLIAPAAEPSNVAVPARTAAIGGTAASQPAATLPAVAPLPAVEAIRPRRGSPAAETHAPKLVAAKPRDESERDELVRSLQRELKRVGCYEGDVDGDWGPGSKRAIRMLTERVNATLPTEDPDYILLTLVRGQQGAGVCGKGCPTTQALDPHGRCVPKAILAQAARKQRSDKPGPGAWSLERRSAEKHEADRLAAEMQAAEKLRQAAELQKATLLPHRVAAATAPSGSGKTTTEPLASSAQPVAAWRTEIQPPPPVAALPGRMAMGGPITPTTPVASQGLTPLKPGALAALDRDSGSSFSTATGTPSGVVPHEEAVGNDRHGTALESTLSERPSDRPQRQRDRDTRHVYRAPPPSHRAYNPPRSRNSARYSSFNRPGAVHNFFFNPHRAF